MMVQERLSSEEIQRLREKLEGLDRVLDRGGITYHLSDLTLALNGVRLLSILMLHVLDTCEADTSANS